MKAMKAELKLKQVTRNIGSMFLDNAQRYAGLAAFAQRENGVYKYYCWSGLVDDIISVGCYLNAAGFDADDPSKQRIAFIAGNTYQRVVWEMAVMSLGLVSVPIFSGYPPDQMSRLIAFADVCMLVTDRATLLDTLPESCLPKRIVLLGEMPDISVLNRLDPRIIIQEISIRSARVSAELRFEIEIQMRAIIPEQMCLIMYTSGTSGFPKGVQLSHLNILSQQAALEQLWHPQSGMRFLCYLPWHHSFGGLFERFFAFHSGGCLATDDSCGKDVDQLLRNFAEIQPHIYFSVPKIYQEIISKVIASTDVEKSFFHDELKFVFTAAAPLPLSISDIFKKKNVPVIEGWGLTETSPCCTLTGFNPDRTAGVVGDAIPGVEIKLGDENELLVRGLNVMSGYFRNEQATEKALQADGWFHTGDIGEIGNKGVRIISRKERMFKLSNGEKVFPAELERGFIAQCKFIKYLYIFGSGERHPFLLVFPNRPLFNVKKSNSLDSSGCSYPSDSAGFAGCLRNCIADVNGQRQAGYEHVSRALIIDRELTLEANELTPSFKLIPKRIEEHFSVYIEAMVTGRIDALPADAYVVDLEPHRSSHASKSAHQPVSSHT